MDPSFANTDSFIRTQLTGFNYCYQKLMFYLHTDEWLQVLLTLLVLFVHSGTVSSIAV